MVLTIRLPDDRYLELSVSDDPDEDPETVSVDIDDIADRPEPEPEPDPEEVGAGLTRLLVVGGLLVVGAAAVRALARERFGEPGFDDTPTEVTVEN